ncbi:MAG: hypothetical protein WC340_17385 [Kiritimatiellia bacterium]
MKKSRKTPTPRRRKIRSKEFERWETCLHEASHCYLWMKLSSDLFRPSMTAVILENGRYHGVAKCSGRLSDYRYAVMLAAGAYGGKLAEWYPRPRGWYQKRKITDRQAANGDVIKADAMRDSFRHDEEHLTDAEMIAQHCIQYEPDNPCDWRARHRRINAHARLLVWRHKSEIRQIAVELYHTGRFYQPAETDPFSNPIE